MIVAWSTYNRKSRSEIYSVPVSGLKRSLTALETRRVNKQPTSVEKPAFGDPRTVTRKPVAVTVEQ